ncbi:MAG: hypothetical protein IJZ72_05365 [Oscillospiraceae bacterium]|nr:hypothetical protein [Oscillospiraceae bacterium]
MNKTVDINERTLENEKSEFITVCKVFEALCIVMTAVFALFVLTVLGVIISLGAELTDIMAFFINSTVLLFGIFSALNFGRAIFKNLKSGETPFRYDIADKVKGASLALLMCGFLSIIVIGVSCSFSEAFSDICHYFFFVAVGNCFVGILLGIMSYVMNYGCKLQQESDETL